MIAEIDRCRDAGDTAGGAFEVIARGLPVGLGSYVHWDRKLDGRLAQAMMSIPAIKGVGIGIGPNAASVPGSQMHDEIVPAPGRTKPPIGVARPTNNAGGLEGGVTNGEDLRVSGFMKPIATLMKPLRSVDLAGMAAAPAVIERSDVCAISAAAVVGVGTPAGAPGSVSAVLSRTAARSPPTSRLISMAPTTQAKSLFRMRSERARSAADRSRPTRISSSTRRNSVRAGSAASWATLSSAWSRA